MERECYICGVSASIFLEQQGYGIDRCPNCGLLFVDPMPTDDYLALVYSPKTGYQSNKIKRNYKKEKNKKFEKIFRELKKYTTRGQKVLDVGASDGEFLYCAKKEGYVVAGVEPNKTTADIANRNGLNVHCGFLENCGLELGSFNILRLGDVLEHSNNPHKLLKECGEFLDTDGLLVVSIPNMDSFWARSTFYLKKWFDLPWSPITPPHHLLYFSKANLDSLFNKKGFVLVSVWYDRPPTLKYELGSTHLLGAFKKDKSSRNFFRLLFGFSSYTFLYVLDYIVTPFKDKDFSMVCIYKKDA